MNKLKGTFQRRFTSSPNVMARPKEPQDLQAALTELQPCAYNFHSHKLKFNTFSSELRNRTRNEFYSTNCTTSSNDFMVFGEVFHQDNQ